MSSPSCCVGFLVLIIAFFLIKKPQNHKQLFQASHESRARSSAFASAAATDEEETIKEEQQGGGGSGKGLEESATTLERRYGSLRPAAVGLLAKVRKRGRPNWPLEARARFKFFSEEIIADLSRSLR